MGLTIRRIVQPYLIVVGAICILWVVYTQSVYPDTFDIWQSISLIVGVTCIIYYMEGVPAEFDVSHLYCDCGKAFVSTYNILGDKLYRLDTCPCGNSKHSEVEIHGIS
jgi:predicted Na+-dependent transporter